MPTYTVGTGKTYASIAAAIAAIPANITGTGIHLVEVYEGGSHEGNGYFYDGQVAVSKTTTAVDYVHIKAMVPHHGQKNRGIIIRHNAGGLVVNIASSYTRLEGFGITENGVSMNGIQVGTCINCLLDKLVVYELDGTGISVVSGMSPATGHIIRNCVVCDLESPLAANNISGISVSGILMGAASAIISNCSILNIQHSVESVNNFGVRVEGLGQIATVTVYNTVVACNTGQTFTDYCANGTTVVALYNCVSSDDTADDFGGSDNLINQDIASDIVFANSTFGSSDARIASPRSCLVDGGAGNSPGFMPPGYEYYNDIAESDRPFNLLFDIGAFEYSIMSYLNRAPRPELKHTIVTALQTNKAYNC